MDTRRPPCCAPHTCQATAGVYYTMCDNPRCIAEAGSVYSIAALSRSILLRISSYSVVGVSKPDHIQQNKGCYDQDGKRTKEGRVSERLPRAPG